MSLTESSSTNINEMDLKQLEQQFQQQMPDNLVKIDSGGYPSYWQSSEGATTAREACAEFFDHLTKLPGIDQCTVRMEHAGAASLILVWAKDRNSTFGGESGYGGNPKGMVGQNMTQSAQPGSEDMPNDDMESKMPDAPDMGGSG